MLYIYILLGLLAVMVLWIIAVYNGLITLKNRTDEAWSDIDVQLKRRYDLIPNLVEAVKGYAKHEAGTLENVIKARNMAMSVDPSDHAAKAEAENMLSSTLKSIFALSENYPDLKASQNFLQLQNDLKDTEDKIQASRRFYNANVRDFNTKIQTFPNNVVAGKLNFSKYDFFEVGNAEERENVKVSF